MIKFKDKTIMILDENGDAIPFQIDSLQSDLIECFELANQSSQSHFVEDIVLALDYALNEQPTSLFFAIQDLRKTVNDLLEEFGFFEIAEIYRNKANFIEPLYSTSISSIKDLLTSKLYFPTSNIDQVAQVIAQKFSLAAIPEATLSLIIEMAKFVNIVLSKPSMPLSLPSEKPSVAPHKYGYYLKEKELISHLYSDFPTFFDLQILRISSISKIHPSIKLHINLSPFATLKNLSAPLTELLIFNDFNSLAILIDQVYNSISLKINTLHLDNLSASLPLYLYFDDISLFINSYFSSSKNRKLAKELSSLISSSLKSPVFKIFLH